jgi:hypothetical protein
VGALGEEGGEGFAGGFGLDGHFFFGLGMVAGGEEVVDVAFVGFDEFEFFVDEGKGSGGVDEDELLFVELGFGLLPREQAKHEWLRMGLLFRLYPKRGAGVVKNLGEDDVTTKSRRARRRTKTRTDRRREFKH